MITFEIIGDFNVRQKSGISDWVSFVLDQEGKELGELNYILCNDDYLYKINNKYLKHNTLTDIISFDFTVGNLVSGDIYISYERVHENALNFDVELKDELHRIMVHGVLHYCGYKDKEEKDKLIMRSKEDYYLSLRTF